MKRVCFTPCLDRIAAGFSIETFPRLGVDFIRDAVVAVGTLASTCSTCLIFTEAEVNGPSRVPGSRKRIPHPNGTLGVRAGHTEPAKALARGGSYDGDRHDSALCRFLIAEHSGEEVVNVQDRIRLVHVEHGDPFHVEEAAQVDLTVGVVSRVADHPVNRFLVLLDQRLGSLDDVRVAGHDVVGDVDDRRLVCILDPGDIGGGYSDREGACCLFGVESRFWLVHVNSCVR